MRSDIPSKQARKVSRILRPFVVIYDRESDRMHTLASPLEDQATLLPLAAWIATETHRHQRRRYYAQSVVLPFFNL